jgi:hypothetical protein
MNYELRVTGTEAVSVITGVCLEIHGDPYPKRDSTAFLRNAKQELFI